MGLRRQYWMDTMFRNIAAPEIFVAAKRFSRRRPVRTFRDGNTIKPPPLIPISVVVAAPHRISTCLLPPEFFAAADGESLELVLADAGENYADQSRPGLKHLDLRGAGLLRWSRPQSSARRKTGFLSSVIMAGRCLGYWTPIEQLSRPMPTSSSFSVGSRDYHQHVAVVLRVLLLQQAGVLGARSTGTEGTQSGQSYGPPRGGSAVRTLAGRWLPVRYVSASGCCGPAALLPRGRCGSCQVVHVSHRACDKFPRRAGRHPPMPKRSGAGERRRRAFCATDWLQPMVSPTRPGV